MPLYALLIRESANRVFAQSAPELLRSELLALGPHLSGGVADVATEELAGLSFATFTAEALSTDDVFILSNLALGRGLFERSDDGQLRPLVVTPLENFDSDLITIQRYTGKTNEQFTHLLVNLAVAASGAGHRRAASGQNIRLLDPVAGRGTTLNRGLMYGFDVAGIELDDKSVDQYRTFLTTYLKDHRVKHKAETERIRKGDLAGTSAFEVTIRPGSPEAAQHVKICRAASSQSAQLFRGQQFDVIVGDLPYGIHHASKRGSAKSGDGNRSPEQLVSDSMPGWKKLLANDGALALSWNTKTVSPDVLARILEHSGLSVIAPPASFEHVVDRQITRDIVVATKS